MTLNKDAPPTAWTAQPSSLHTRLAVAHQKLAEKKMQFENSSRRRGSARRPISRAPSPLLMDDEDECPLLVGASPADQVSGPPTPSIFGDDTVGLLSVSARWSPFDITGGEGSAMVAAEHTPVNKNRNPFAESTENIASPAFGRMSLRRGELLDDTPGKGRETVVVAQAAKTRRTPEVVNRALPVAAAVESKVVYKAEEPQAPAKKGRKKRSRCDFLKSAEEDETKRHDSSEDEGPERKVKPVLKRGDTSPRCNAIRRSQFPEHTDADWKEPNEKGEILKEKVASIYRLWKDRKHTGYRGTMGPRLYVRLRTEHPATGSATANLVDGAASERDNNALQTTIDACYKHPAPYPRLCMQLQGIPGDMTLNDLNAVLKLVPELKPRTSLPGRNAMIVIAETIVRLDLHNQYPETVLPFAHHFDKAYEVQALEDRKAGWDAAKWFARHENGCHIFCDSKKALELAKMTKKERAAHTPEVQELIKDCTTARVMFDSDLLRVMRRELREQFDVTLDQLWTCDHMGHELWAKVLSEMNALYLAYEKPCQYTGGRTIKLELHGDPLLIHLKDGAEEPLFRMVAVALTRGLAHQCDATPQAYKETAILGKPDESMKKPALIGTIDELEKLRPVMEAIGAAMKVQPKDDHKWMVRLFASRGPNWLINSPYAKLLIAWYLSLRSANGDKHLRKSISSILPTAAERKEFKHARYALDNLKNLALWQMLSTDTHDRLNDLVRAVNTLERDEDPPDLSKLSEHDIFQECASQLVNFCEFHRQDEEGKNMEGFVWGQEALDTAVQLVLHPDNRYRLTSDHMQVLEIYGFALQPDVCAKVQQLAESPEAEAIFQQPLPAGPVKAPGNYYKALAAAVGGSTHRKTEKDIRKDEREEGKKKSYEEICAAIFRGGAATRVP